MSLRSTINWLITLVMVLFIISLTALQIASSRQSINAEMQASTLITVQMLTNLLGSENGQRSTVAPQVPMAFLEQTGRIRSHDIDVQNTFGQTLYTSPPSPYKSGRSAPRWFTRLVAPQVEATILPLDGGQVRIMPEYSRMVLDAWDQLLNLFWLSLALLSLVNLLVFWFAGRALKENRAWMQLIQRHIEDERRTLALELHDEVGQSLTAVKTIATSLANRTRDKHAELHQPAQMIVDVSAGMYDSMHNIVRQLRPLVLDQLGLQAALQELVGSQQARYPGIQFSLTINGDLTRVSPELAIAAYRMVQECLTNVVRHAAATQADVTVDASDSLVLTVRDNGNGQRVDPNDRSERFGLMGMRERAEGLGGSFHWHGDRLQTADRGVRVVVSLPLATEKR